MQTSKSWFVVAATVAAVCIGSSCWAGDPDTDAQAKARQALREKMQNLEQPFQSYGEAPAAPATDPAAIEKAREALRKKMSQIERDPSQAASSDAEARAMRGAKRSAATAFPPIERPASPLSTDQQQKLAELLKRYQADELTPEEYHRERAKILGMK